MPILRLSLLLIPLENADVEPGRIARDGYSWWHGANLPSWNYDERRENDLEFTHRLESLMAAAEKYMDFRLSNLLVHIGNQKAKVCEMEIQPAMLIAGMIPEDPDLASLNLVQRETQLLHKSMAVERKYHWEEQSRAFTLVPLIRAALRDIDRPLPVLQACQRTSLKWWKCRKSARELHDYLHDMVIFLNYYMAEFRSTRNLINRHTHEVKELDDKRKYIVHDLTDNKNQQFVTGKTPDEHQRGTHYVQEMDEIMQFSWGRRLAKYYNFMIKLRLAERLARGDGNTAELKVMSAKMKDVLTKMLADVEPLLHDIPQSSRDFQMTRIEHILQLYDLTCDRVKFQFYGGGSNVALQNRHGYFVMAAPDMSPDAWYAGPLRMADKQLVAGNAPSTVSFSGAGGNFTMPKVSPASIPGAIKLDSHVAQPKTIAALKPDVETTQSLLHTLRVEGMALEDIREDDNNTESAPVNGSAAWLPPSYTGTLEKANDKAQGMVANAWPISEKDALRRGQDNKKRWEKEQVKLKKELKRRNTMFATCMKKENEKKTEKIGYYADCIAAEKKKRKEWQAEKDKCSKKEGEVRGKWADTRKTCIDNENKKHDAWAEKTDKCVKDEDKLRDEWKKTQDKCAEGENKVKDGWTKSFDECVGNENKKLDAWKKTFDKCIEDENKKRDEWTKITETCAKDETKVHEAWTKAFDTCVSEEEKVRDEWTKTFDTCKEEESKVRDEWAKLVDTCNKEEDKMRDEWAKVFDTCVKEESKVHDEWAKVVDTCVKDEEKVREEWKKVLDECVKAETEEQKRRDEVCSEWRIMAEPPQPEECTERDKPKVLCEKNQTAEFKATCEEKQAEGEKVEEGKAPDFKLVLPSECDPKMKVADLCASRNEKDLEFQCKAKEEEAGKAEEGKADIKLLAASECKPKDPVELVCELRQNITLERECTTKQEEAGKAEEGKADVKLVVASACQPKDTSADICNARQVIEHERACTTKSEEAGKAEEGKADVKLVVASECKPEEAVENICTERQVIEHERACKAKEDEAAKAEEGKADLKSVVASECRPKEKIKVICTDREIISHERKCTEKGAEAAKEPGKADVNMVFASECEPKTPKDDICERRTELTWQRACWKNGNETEKLAGEGKEIDVAKVVFSECAPHETSEKTCLQRQDLTWDRACVKAVNETIKLTKEGKVADVNIVVKSECQPHEKPENTCTQRQDITWERDCKKAENETAKLFDEGKQPDVNLLIKSQCTPHEKAESICRRRQEVTWERKCNKTLNKSLTQNLSGKVPGVELVYPGECFPDDPSARTCNKRDNLTWDRACRDAQNETSRLTEEGTLIDINLLVYTQCDPYAPPLKICQGRENITWKRACNETMNKTAQKEAKGEKIKLEEQIFSECYAHNPIVDMCEVREDVSITNKACEKSLNETLRREFLGLPISPEQRINSECLSDHPPEEACELRALYRRDLACNASLNHTRDMKEAGKEGELKPTVSECLPSVPPMHYPADPPEAMCEQPRLPTLFWNLTFFPQIKEFQQMLAQLDTDLWEAEYRAETEQGEILSMWQRYHDSQPSVDSAGDLVTARMVAIEDISRRMTEAKGLIKLREKSFALETEWMKKRQKLMEESIPKHCAETDCSEWEKSHNQARKEILVREAEKDTLLYIDKSLKDADQTDMHGEHWSLPLLSEMVQELTEEEEDVNTDAFKETFWYGPSVDDWTGEERRDNDLAAIDVMENILEGGQKYHNYRHATIIEHLTRRKAEFCELDLQPAMLMSGILTDKPYVAPIEFIQDVSRLFQDVMEIDRGYYSEEQSRVWSMLPVLRAAKRDNERPDDVLQTCQKTSLMWYKCRKASYILMDYLEDMTVFLDEHAMAFRKLLQRFDAQKVRETHTSLFKVEHDHFLTLTKAVDDHFVDAHYRLRKYYAYAAELINVEALAKGNSNTVQLQAMKSRMSTLLGKIESEVTPYVTSLPEKSRILQNTMTKNMLELMDRKCTLIKRFFYLGDSLAAEVNREAHEVLTNEDPDIANYEYVDVDALPTSCDHTTIPGCVKASLIGIAKALENPGQRPASFLAPAPLALIPEVSERAKEASETVLRLLRD